MSGPIGDTSHFGGLRSMDATGFIENDTRITVSLPRPDHNVAFVVHVGQPGMALHVDRSDLARLRDALTEALDATAAGGAR